MLHSLQALAKLPDEKAKDLFLMLQNNIFYVLEYREVVLHLLINYKETNSTRYVTFPWHNLFGSLGEPFFDTTPIFQPHACSVALFSPT